MIVTTIEQAKRLIRAGFNAEETADFYYNSKGVLEWRGEPVLFMIADFQTPAWSLGALWNLCNEYCMVFDTQEDTAEQVIETMVTRLIAYKNIE